MEAKKRRFFVTGYPRSRTAWLATLLGGDGVRCEHEASRGRGLEGVAEAFDAWEERVTGMCDSGLLPQVEALTELYPDARWVMIHRESREALSSLMADRPELAEECARKWPELEAAYEKARLVLRGTAYEVDYGEIDGAAAEIYRHCTGREAPKGKAEALRGLKITQIPERARALPEEAARSAVERMGERGFDLTGLTARLFEPGRDMLLFTEWASREHGPGARLAPVLPPLGAVVEDEAGPKAMIFCRECYGVPAADLEFSVTRPGLGMREASAAMAFAAAVCMEMAGRLVWPPAGYSVFRVTCGPAMGRFVRRMGFQPHGDSNCQKYIYQK